MVQISHKGENLDKINEILAAAQKRFGMYGIDKTSVSEIAADLAMSKGSIYYYFPDKDSLYMAVVEKEHTEFLETVEESIGKMSNADDMVREYIRLNLKYFRTLLNLSRTRIADFMSNAHMRQFINGLRMRDVELLSRIFSKGTENGLFKLDNAEEIAKLFLDLQKGLRHTIIGKNEIFYLENEEYSVLIHKVNLFTEIFINGLKHK